MLSNELENLEASNGMLTKSDASKMITQFKRISVPVDLSKLLLK